MARIQPLQELLQIVVIAAGFGAALAAYRAQYPDNFGFLTSDELLLGYLTSICTFWAVVKLLEVSSSAEIIPRLIDEFCMGTGLNLLVDAVLNYFQILTRSLYLIVVGGFFVVVLLALLRMLLPERKDRTRAGTLMVGCDPILYRLAGSLKQPILGVVGSASACPPDVAFLGTEDRLAEIIAERNPLHILAARDGTPRAAASALLSQRLNGVAVLETSGLYEKLLRRVYCRGTQPMDLLVSGALDANSRILAIQAVYTNLLGLILLFLLSPVLALTALAVGLFSGRGPLIETTECSGFHNIPFRLMSFRTTRTDGTGAMTAVGVLITRLHLTHLPQLFNIVRGEMALFGPRPVRLAFTRRLTELMPFYTVRLFVKPGMISWARVQMPRESFRGNELTEIEYDLYYIRQGSPLLDLEILSRTLLFEKPSALATTDFALPAH
ncbi:MAG TPA: sugar transferase [Bryobacteraceae bacterium]|jgi:lipopolysaccharide/colanic/teichoic acid biosynthesis glycosyltransferase